MQSIEKQILSDLKRRGRGSVTSPSDYTRLGSREAVAQSLHRMVQNGTIRNIARGLYLYPKIHPDIGELSPDPEKIAKAVAGRDRTRIQPTGAYAANLLGLSDQVPAKIVFLTDGASRLLKASNMTIQLRRTTPRNMAAAGRLSGLVIQGLRFLGKPHVKQHHIDHLKRTLPAHERSKLIDDLTIAPAWMRPILREIAESAR